MKIKTKLSIAAGIFLAMPQVSDAMQTVGKFSHNMTNHHGWHAMHHLHLTMQFRHNHTLNNHIILKEETTWSHKIKDEHIQTLSEVDPQLGHLAREIKKQLDSVKQRGVSEKYPFIEECKKLSEEVRTIHLPNLKIEACKAFSEDMKKFIGTYAHRTEKYGVIQKSYPFLYSNIESHARESHADLCHLIGWVEGDGYVGPNMIGRKHENILCDQYQISECFKQTDSSFDSLPDDLQQLIVDMLENSKKMYEYTNFLLDILRSRVTQEFDISLCIKMLKKDVKPILGELDPQLNEDLESLCGYLKCFDGFKTPLYCREIDVWSRGGDFVDYRHLSYGMRGLIRERSWRLKLTPEESAAEDFIRNIYTNIGIRHDPNDSKQFIPAPYIVDRCKGSPRLPLEKPSSEESIRAWIDIWLFEVNENIIAKPQNPHNYNSMCYLGDDNLYRLLTEEYRQKRIEILIDKIDVWLEIIDGQMNGEFSGRHKEYKMNHSLANKIKNSLIDRLSNSEKASMAPSIVTQRDSLYSYLDSLGKGDNLDELSYQIFQIYKDVEEILRQSSLK